MLADEWYVDCLENHQDCRALRGVVHRLRTYRRIDDGAAARRNSGPVRDACTRRYRPMA